MGIKIHNHYITGGYELSRKEVLKMMVKVRKKPVRKAERANNAKKIGNNALFGEKVRGILSQLPKSIVVDNGCEFIRISLETDKSYSYEDIRSYIAAHFEEYKKTHPLKKGRNSEPAAIIEAEKQRYANFLWEFMNFVVCQD